MCVAFIKMNVNIQKLPPRTAKKSFFTLESKNICINLWPYKNNLKNNVTTKVSESEKSPLIPIKHIAKTPGKGQHGTAQVLLIIYRHKSLYVKGKILILRCTENAPASTSLKRCRHTT